VTPLDAALGALAPAALVAVTVNVTFTLLVKPVIVIGETVLEEEIPVFDVAIKLVIVFGNPVSVGAVKVTVAIVFPFVAVPIIGAPGILGQMLSFRAVCTSDKDQIPLAFPDAVPFRIPIIPPFLRLI
jgi:hypothetical protein